MSLHALFVGGPTQETTGPGEKITNGLLTHSVLWSCNLGKRQSWGFCTPAYMLNNIIRMQAVVKIITNETVRALNLLAK
jgi:hypothetical protein